MRCGVTQWQLSPVLVRAELSKLCSPLGEVESIYIAPYVDGPRENKLRNALKVRRCLSPFVHRHTEQCLREQC